jgi:spore coat polysaccharide biosynthesis protein SpsF (cytidylyltransferase family)
MPDLLHRDDIRLTFDTKDDLAVIKQIFSELNTLDFSYKDVLNVLENNNKLLTKMKTSINTDFKLMDQNILPKMDQKLILV